MAALSTFATIATIASAGAAVKSAFTKPKTSGAATNANAQITEQVENDKRKKALQAMQRTPTETLLTGGQGASAKAATLG